MKHTIKSLLICSVGAVAILFIQCRSNQKDPAPNNSTTTGTNTTTTATTQINSEKQADDSKNINDGVDNALNSVKDGLSEAPKGGRPEVVQGCGVTIDYTKWASEKKVTYTYDGVDCKNGGVIRRGVIVVTLISGTKYSDVNAKYQADFQAYTVTINGKSVFLQGTVFSTNTTGGDPAGVILGQTATVFFGGVYKATVIERMRGSATASIDGNTLAGWSAARKTTWQRLDTTWKISIDGDTTIGEFSKVIEWGGNRFGETFVKEMTTPFSISSTCGDWLAFLRPSGGVCKITVTKPDKKKYYILWEWLLDTKSCANGISLSISDDDNNKWNTTVKY